MKISVIITSYNYSNIIGEAINSVLCQLFDDFEIIIADDASTDNSVEVIKEFQNRDDRIKLITNETNLGIAKTLQKAVLKAQGEWIVLLESDDILKPEYFSEKLKISENYPEAGLIYNAVEFFGENSAQAQKKFQNIINRNSKRKEPQNMFYDFGYNNYILTMSSVMVKSEYLKSVRFDTPVDKLTDWYIYVQLAQKTKFLYLNKQLTLFRQHDNSYIKSDKRKKRRFANISAYIQVFKTQPYNIFLLIFIIISTVRMIIKRILAKISQVKFYENSI